MTTAPMIASSMVTKASCRVAGKARSAISEADSPVRSEVPKSRWMMPVLLTGEVGPVVHQRQGRGDATAGRGHRRPTRSDQGAADQPRVARAAATARVAFVRNVTDIASTAI